MIKYQLDSLIQWIEDTEATEVIGECMVFIIYKVLESGVIQYDYDIFLSYTMEQEYIVWEKIVQGKISKLCKPF